MKKMKKLFAVILSLAMVLGMSITSFAEDSQDSQSTEREKDTATITVQQLDKDATVTYKQIIEPDVESITGWKFSDEADLEAFDEDEYAAAKGSEDAIEKLEQNVIYKLLKMKNTTLPNKTDKTDDKSANVEAYSANEFATAVGKISTSTDVTDEDGNSVKANESGEIAWNVIKAGVYVINANSTNTDYSYSTMAAYVSFNSDYATNKYLDDAKVTAKSSKTEIKKEADDEDKVVEVGKTVEYTVTTKVPYVNDASPIYSFKIIDTITGAEYVTVPANEQNGGKVAVKVTVGSDKEKTLYADVTEDGSSFTLDLSRYLGWDETTSEDGSTVYEKGTDFNKYANTSVTLKYSATVTGLQATNKVKWNDGNTDISEVTEELYTSSAYIHKTDKDDKDLGGAEFVVVKYETENDKLVTYYAIVEKLDEQTTAEDTDMIEVYSENGYKVTGWTKDLDKAKKNTVITTSEEDGAALVSGLEGNKNYKFQEVKAPKGYSVNKTNVTITWKSQEVTEDPGVVYVGEAEMVDTKLSSLPSTGGIGTTIFTIAGCAIMIAAAGLFFASRKKSDNK